MVTWAQAIAPRLTYRLRYGAWCDHQGVLRARTVEEIDSRTPYRPGWGPWEMWDLGRDKIRSCRRCGHVETASGHPFRDPVIAWWRHLSDHARTTWLVVTAALAGVACILASWTPWWPLVLIGYVTAAWCALIAVALRWEARRWDNRR